MDARIDFFAQPAIARNLKQLSAAGHLPDAILPASTQELCRLRASQINGCAFCTDMHTKDALAQGESLDRIVQLNAWEESRHFYTAREIAAIELTEAITVLTDGFVPDEVYERAAAHFDDKELARLISSIVVINAWNRFGVSTRMVPGHYTPATHAH